MQAYFTINGFHCTTLQLTESKIETKYIFFRDYQNIFKFRLLGTLGLAFQNFEKPGFSWILKLKIRKSGYLKTEFEALGSSMQHQVFTMT